MAGARRHVTRFEPADLDPRHTVLHAGVLGGFRHAPSAGRSLARAPLQEPILASAIGIA
jgi:hypothetical protein